MCVIWSVESSLTLQEELKFVEHPREPTIQNVWFQLWNTGEVLWWFGQQHRGTVFCWFHYYFNGRIIARQDMDRLGNLVHPMICTLFPKNDEAFQDDNAPFIQLGLFSYGLNSMKVNFSIFPGQHIHQIWTSLYHSGQFWRLEWGTDSHLQHP
jgi:hypothetical protein